MCETSYEELGTQTSYSLCPQDMYSPGGEKGMELLIYAMIQLQLMHARKTPSRPEHTRKEE